MQQQYKRTDTHTHTHTHLHSVNDMSRATGSVRAAFFLLLSLSASPPSTLRGFVQPRCAHTWLPSPSSHPVLSFPLSFLCCFAAGHTNASAVTRHMARATGSGAREYGEGRMLFTTPGWLPVALSRRAHPNSFSHMRKTFFSSVGPAMSWRRVTSKLGSYSWRFFPPLRDSHSRPREVFRVPKRIQSVTQHGRQRARSRAKRKHPCTRGMKG